MSWMTKLRARSQNPFLPKPSVIRWRKGPFAKTQSKFQPEADRKTEVVGDRSPPYDFVLPLEKLPPKTQRLKTQVHGNSSDLQARTTSGQTTHARENFFCESNSGWGSNLDMIAIAHGGVGCGAFAQTSRLNLPGFVQGADSFTALDFCTGLNLNDLKDGGDAKLTRSLQEAQDLFPLARGVIVLNEEPISFIDSNFKGIAKESAKTSGKMIISMGTGVAGAFNWTLEVAASLKAAVRYKENAVATAYDVAVPFDRTTPGLVWIVSKLLRDIGLNPIHERTGSSASDMARIQSCKLVIGFAESLDVPADYFPDGNAQLLRRWFGIPLIWTCFLNPSATDASLRLIASHFDAPIQRRAEQVISANRKKINAVLRDYRPRLQDRLILDFFGMPETQLESYRSLGFRIGNANGWTGKTGVWRKPRLACDPHHQTQKAIDSYIAEAKPDIVFYLKRHEYDWHKRGQSVMPFTPLFDHRGDSHWGYDGFACLAAALDRAVNAPWRKLVKPPWAADSG